MTDKEIIKGLECCASESIEDCQVCPYMFDTIYCEQMKLRADALDLINRRKAEIEELKLIYEKERADRLYLSQQNKAIIAGQETLQKALAKKDREVERLTAEKEQLIKTFGECQAEATKALVDKDKEIERLKNNISAMAVTMRNCAKATRAEAIRAFAERLKEQYEIWDDDECYFDYVTTGQIDNLVKEMAGDTE